VKQYTAKSNNVKEWGVTGWMVQAANSPLSVREKRGVVAVLASYGLYTARRSI